MTDSVLAQGRRERREENDITAHADMLSLSWERSPFHVSVFADWTHQRVANPCMSFCLQALCN